MNQIPQPLIDRCEGKCELCNTEGELKIYPVPPDSEGLSEDSIACCGACQDLLLDSSRTDPDHWRCLNDSMWNPAPPVQVVIYRLLHSLRDEGWPLDLLDMMYIDDNTKSWAERTMTDDEPVIHKDSNGVILNSGDSVTLIKDLKVKGAGFTAKRGTSVRRISLVSDNPNHIEGRVNDQRIVILTQYVKKNS